MSEYVEKCPCPGNCTFCAVGWGEVECEDCGASWQDVWALTDITEAKDKDGKEITA